MRRRWPWGRALLDLEDLGPPPGIGHNRGPALDPTRRWRAHCWAKARAETFKVPPPEVLRRQVARAAELGLSWKDYFAIRVGTGRDVSAYLVMGPVPEGGLEGFRRVVLLWMGTGTPPPGVDGAVEMLPAGASLLEARAAVLGLLKEHKLPGDGVVMIGRFRHERAWAEAARLAKFLDAERFFRR